MAKNEILRFCENDIGTNLLSQEEYQKDAHRLIGNQPGIARSALVNKMLRQSATIAAGVGEFIKDLGHDCTDNDSPQTISQNLREGFTIYGRVPVAVADKNNKPNEITATFDVPVSLTNGMLVVVRARYASTGAVTFAPNGLDAKPVYKDNGVALASGDISGESHWLELCFDKELDKWCLTNPTMNATIKQMANFLYPIGCIFTSSDENFDPNVTFGGVWEELPPGYFLESQKKDGEMLFNFRKGVPEKENKVGKFEVATEIDLAQGFERSNEVSVDDYGKAYISGFVKYQEIAGGNTTFPSEFTMRTATFGADVAKPNSFGVVYWLRKELFNG